MADSDDSSSLRPTTSNNETITQNTNFQPNPRNYEQYMLDPYFMHTSDIQGLSIVTSLLNKSNYHS